MAVKVTNSWPVCHQLEHYAAEDPQCRGWRRCSLNRWRAQTPSHWCDGEVRKGRCRLRCRPRHLTLVQNLQGPLPTALV
ncbi:hypothetical protein TNCV_2338821 [Trichonephila clavipes]|nr:hypothetical protein TNCV_2338821 [Trichonephila clavipes]